MVSALVEEGMAATEAVSQAPAVKLLDLITNRYHAGVVERADEGSLRVQMPATTRLRPGQRVRCIVASPSSGVLSRGQMRRASVLRVERPVGAPRLLLELAYMDDPTAS